MVNGMIFVLEQGSVVYQEGLLFFYQWQQQLAWETLASPKALNDKLII